MAVRFGAKPSEGKERIPTIDILRGFALFGVVLMNSQSMISWANLDSQSDQWVVWCYKTFIAGRFYRLFAFLFGLGFVLQMNRLESRGVTFGPIYLRRLAILLVFGLLHGFFVWPNDILALFAQFGLLLFLFRRWSNRSIFAVIVATLLLSHIYYYASMGFADFRTVDPVAFEQRAEERALEREAERVERNAIRAEGSYWEYARWNAGEFSSWRFSIQSNLALLGEEFLMILLGFFVGRLQVFERLQSFRPFIKKTLWWCLGLSVVWYFLGDILYELHAPPGPEPLVAITRNILENICLAAGALFYASAITLLAQGNRCTPCFKPIALLGRMSLTHYLLISLIITTLFNHFGLGWYGDVQAFGGFLLAIGIYAFQLGFSFGGSDISASDPRNGCGVP